MWRLIKWIAFIAIIGCVILWFTGYRVKGKTIQEHLNPFFESKAVKEATRDLRTIVGEGLKAAGEAISEDVTDKERKQLDDVVKKELMEGKPIGGAPGQTALKPEKVEEKVDPATKNVNNLEKAVDQIMGGKKEPPKTAP